MRARFALVESGPHRLGVHDGGRCRARPCCLRSPRASAAGSLFTGGSRLFTNGSPRSTKSNRRRALLTIGRSVLHRDAPDAPLRRPRRPPQTTAPCEKSPAAVFASPPGWLPSRADPMKAVHKESFQRQPTGRVFFVSLCCSVMTPWRRCSRARSSVAQTPVRAARTDRFTRSAVPSECRPMRKPPRPPHPIPPFVAPRYGDTPEEDRAFRREMLLSALTDALFRLRCRQLGIELPPGTPPHVPARRARKAEPRP
jgi:hypothetical protein